MATRKLQVEIIGDASSFQAAMRTASASATQFGQTVETKLGRSTVSVADKFQPLLSQTRQMQDQASALSRRLDAMGAAASESAAPGLGSVIAKAGIATIAISALYQASQHLQQALKVTGAEAFTTGGKLRNFAASLTSGDIVGAVQALAAQPKTLQEAGISAEEATIHYRAFKQEADNVSGSMGNLAREAVKLVEAQNAAQNAADSLADYVSRLGTAFETSTGQAVTFKGAVDDLAGMRGPGGVNQINLALRANRRARQERAFTPIGPTAKNEAAQIVAAATGDLPALLRLQVVARDRLQKAVDASIHKTLQARQELNQKLAQARAAVITTQHAINQQAAADAAAAAAAEKARQAEAKRRAAEAAALRKQLAEQARNRRLAQLAAEQARQFRAIGLTPGGQELAPTAASLRRQFAALSRNVVGEDVPRNLRDRLARVGRFLKGDLKGITEDTRRAIEELFQTIRGTFDKESKKTRGVTTVGLNTGKFIEGLGLSPAQTRDLRARLSHLSATGQGRNTATATGFAGAVYSTVTVNLDGHTVAQNTTKHQQKAKRRNPPQRRGWGRGGF